MRPTNRYQSADTYIGYPQLQWAEQHQAMLRRIAAEARQTCDARPARPSFLVRAALLLVTARGWAATIATGAGQPKTVR